MSNTPKIQTFDWPVNHSGLNSYPTRGTNCKTQLYMDIESLMGSPRKPSYIAPMQNNPVERDASS